MTRFLLRSEIDDILNILPLIPGSNRNSRRKVTEEVKKALRFDLSQYKIKEEMIEQLKQIIFKKYVDSLAIPGTPAGIRTAEALGSNTTQTALNSFHFTGTEKGNITGLDQTLENMNATKKERKNQFTRAHFRNMFTSFVDILKMRKIFVESNVQYLLNERKSHMMTYDQAYNEIFYNLYYRTHNISEDDKINPEITPYCFELSLDTYKLYQNKILISDVIDALMERFYTEIKCVAFPTEKGLIHIYPKPEFIPESDNSIKREGVTEEESVKMAIQLFIHNIFAPSLKTIVVKGMSGNKSITAIKVKMMDVVKSYSKFRIDTQEVKDVIQINFYPKKMRENGITFERFEKYMEFMGYEILYSPVHPNINEGITEEVMLGAYPDYTMVCNLVKMENVSGDNKINRQNLSAVDSYYRDKKGKREEERKEYKRNRGDYEMNGFYYYAQIDGSNYIDIMAHPLIDPNRTISNNPSQMAKYLGIGVCAKILDENYSRLNADSYVNQRHTANLVKFQTSQGSYISVTSRGAARQPIGPMAKASFQEATKCFVQGAAFGVYESTNSVSTSVYIGKRVKLGSGYVNIVPAPNAEELEIYPQIFNKKLYKDNVVTEDLDNNLDNTDEVKDAGQFNMPPNYPPPKMITCIRELPPFFMSLIKTDVYAQIRAILSNNTQTFSVFDFMKSGIKI